MEDDTRWTICLGRRHREMLCEVLAVSYSICGARPAEEHERLDSLIHKLHHAKSRVDLTTGEIGLLVSCLRQVSGGRVERMSADGESSPVLTSEEADFYRKCLKLLPDIQGDIIGAIGKIDGSRLIVLPSPSGRGLDRTSTVPAADEETGQTRRARRTAAKPVTSPVPLKFLGPPAPITGARRNRRRR